MVLKIYITQLKILLKNILHLKVNKVQLQVSDGLDQVYTMTSEEAVKAISAGTLDVSQINKQTLGSNKWFVQGSKAKLIILITRYN